MRALFGMVLIVSGCPSALQPTPDPLCRVDADCSSGEQCALSDEASYGVCVRACGNGTLDTGEECDDGNSVEDDGCTSACLACGNGVRSEGEVCDDGDRDGTNACTNRCARADCGDGILRTDLEPSQPGFEACDDGNDVNTDSCTAACTVAVCGDGFVRTDIREGEPGYEACDDGRGDRSNNDDCTDSCQVARCGDGIRHDAAEECDDGNAVDTDGCRDDCRLGYCGDGVVRTDEDPSDPAREVCDDGNNDPEDDCAYCKPARCGDGYVQRGVEECDHADTPQNGEFGVVNSDQGACTLGCRRARCGDGLVRSDRAEGDDGFEACDDGNLTDGDGCTSDCQHEFQTSDGLYVNVACDEEQCQVCRPFEGPGAGSCLTVVPFEGGTFSMGSSRPDAVDAFDPHQVTVSSFMLAKTETTKAEWGVCLDAAPDHCAASVDLRGEQEAPVGVTWVNAQSFCAWYGGRLPTEAEWEFAATGRGARRPYPWGEGEPTCARLYCRSLCEGGENLPVPVCGMQRQTPEGVCDLAGNVREWTYDRYRIDTIPTPAPQGEQPILDPVVYEAQSDKAIMRGGYSNRDELRYFYSASRIGQRKSTGAAVWGFRCVWSGVALDQMTRR